MAAPSVADFLADYPTFALMAAEASGLALVTAKLAVAVRRYDEEACGAVYRDLVLRKTAQLLALEPFGQQARMVNKDGSTTYDAELEQMELAGSMGGRVV